MEQKYDPAAKALINTDEQGVVRELLHEEPQVSDAATAQQAAHDYIMRHAELLGLQPAELHNLTMAREAEPVAAAGEIRLHSEKQQFDMTTVTYDQTHFGLPVWESGLSVHLKNGPFRVVGAESMRHDDISVKRPGAKALSRFKNLKAAALAKLLGLTAKSKDYDRTSLKVEQVRLVVYRYEAAKRAPMPETIEEGNAFQHEDPTLPLPPLPRSIVEGGHYVAAAVHFELATRQFPELHWRAIIDVETGAVLHLRAFVDGVNGMVFFVDPMTSAPSGPAASGTNAQLNLKRTSVVLPGLNAPVAGTQALSGALAIVKDVELPTIAPPTKPTGSNFDFNARTNDFAAVSAYFHTDRFFRFVQSLGFPLPTYFGPTPFPSPVDHRGLGNPPPPASNPLGNVINAHCLGLAGGVGILQSAYALADLGDTANPIGIACDWRVVLHELGGHGILYPHVHSPNFGFAHSAGDSFAAIINDPNTAAAGPLRFVTFPWVNIGRNHDRPVAGGWAWGGVNDVGGYSSEQILSTSHFRFYRSIGGDSTQPNMRLFASRFACYLILRAVGSLTPTTNPNNVSGYVTKLLAADLGDWTSEGHAGGAYGKVIRWAFEQQGLFQAPGAPTPVVTVGKPPAVDVYIEDGRHGEYPFQPVYWNCQAIWNRRLADGLTTHEAPVVGVTNFAYVKIKNRGTQGATNVVVKAFHANPAAGLVYPNDWQAMTTPQLAAANVPGNNAAEVVVGPFKWTPTHVGHECIFMVASAAGDPSNVSNLSPGESIPEWRLVPNDNNIGQRNVAPVSALNVKDLVAAISKMSFTLKNPHPVAAKMELKPIIPRILAARGWKLEFTNPGGGLLRLGSGATKEINLSLTPGEKFTPQEIAKAKDAAIIVEAYADGILVGGMTFPLSAGSEPPKPALKKRK
ncbi:MAG TPA: hypothetical protein VGO11_05010 [Chthoniobacteraceae bacterium]|jgi:hypothetical protein|nr:hypothetical protein [Chthoniobacteraceae bacterium]